MRKILLAATLTLVLAGCQSTPEAEKPAGVEDRTPGATRPAPSATTQPVRPGSMSGNPLKDPSSILSKRTIYFDFDRDDIKVEFVPVVEAHGKYLRDNRGAKMLIQGSADERGSREYNLALGQRRSEAIKKRLMVLGVTETQIESVSLGEEKPACVDHDEGCWYKNRRGDMLYGGEF
ncbi:MAG: peptidoglycan-associated lipoprotein Pal [Burkholderiales bacterium]